MYTTDQLSMPTPSRGMSLPGVLSALLSVGGLIAATGLALFFVAH